MVIKDHKIEGAWRKLSPNHGGALVNPPLLVLHYTASGGDNADAVVNYFLMPAAKASAHLVIGRDGSIGQVVPFNVQAWHAGRSVWRGRSGCNNFSLGIEIVNWGPLTKAADGTFRSWANRVVPASEVAQAAHKNDGVMRYWHIYPEAQLKAVAEVCEALVERYPSIKEIVGHDDVSPGRKTDPGPLFPMSRMVSAAYGRGEKAPDTDQRIVTASSLNIRGNPTTSSPVIGSLKRDEKVTVVYDAGEWAQLSTGGWVADRYLRIA